MQQHHRIRPAFTLGILTISSALWLAGCASKPVPEDVPPPPQLDELQATQQSGDGQQTMLDWPGTYQAVLPCNGCAGIAISVQLRENGTAIVRERRLGSDIEKEAPQTYNGPFQFDRPGSSTITLAQANESTAYRFFVSEGWIEMRARESGEPLPQNTLFRLRKTSQPNR